MGYIYLERRRLQSRMQIAAHEEITRIPNHAAI